MRSAHVIRVRQRRSMTRMGKACSGIAGLSSATGMPRRWRCATRSWSPRRTSASCHSPEMLRPWLYAIARAECQRRQQSRRRGARRRDRPARPARRRPPADRLARGDEPEPGRARGARADDQARDGHRGRPRSCWASRPASWQAILERARVHLEQALAGEILARHGVHGCPERAEALQGWAGELTVPLRERLVQARHVVRGLRSATCRATSRPPRSSACCRCRYRRRPCGCA